MGLAEKYAAYQTFKENLRGQKLQNDERQRLADLQRGMTTAAQSPNITTMQMQPEPPQLSLSALGRQMQPQQFQPAHAEVSPVVDAYRDGRMQTQTVKRSPELAAFEYLRQNDPQAAQAYAEKVMSAARSIALNGDHPGAVDYTNRSLGLNLKYAGTEGEFIKLANADGTVTLYNPKTEEERVIGTPKGPAEPYKPGELKEFQNDRTKIWREYVGKGQWRDRPDLGQATIDKPVQPKIVVQGAGKGGGEPKPAKPLPVSALKMQQEGVDAIGTASGIRADLGELRMQVETGALDLGPMKNLWNKGRNWAGWSSPQSRNLQSFTATLQKLRNDSLRLNKGVQTDGDAQRAWAELIDNINDPKAVSQRLQEIDAINERAVLLHQSNVDNVRNNYGLDPLDTSIQRGVEPAIGRGKDKPKGSDKRPPLSAIFGTKR